MPGFFCSVDGVDGGGKSTQIRLLAEWFQQQGRETIVVRDPGGTKLGEALRDILLHRQEIPLCMEAEMLLYMASRAQLVHDTIRPALDADQVVIADRFLLANVVYQGVAGGLETEKIWQVGAIATGGLMPEISFILDVDAEISLSRIQGGLDRLESRGLDYMKKVRAGFLSEGRQLGENVRVVDATQSIEAIHSQIVSAIQSS